jgi:hypothetical protein
MHAIQISPGRIIVIWNIYTHNCWITIEVTDGVTAEWYDDNGAVRCTGRFQPKPQILSYVTISMPHLRSSIQALSRSSCFTVDSPIGEMENPRASFQVLQRDDLPGGYNGTAGTGHLTVAARTGKVTKAAGPGIWLTLLILTIQDELSGAGRLVRCLPAGIVRSSIINHHSVSRSARHSSVTDKLCSRTPSKPLVWSKLNADSSILWRRH